MMVHESGGRPKFDLEARGSDEEQDLHQAFNLVVGESIRKARQEHGWTQAFLAEQARLSTNYVARLERGELGPSLFVATRICEALGIDLEVLVGPPAGRATRKTAKRRAV